MGMSDKEWAAMTGGTKKKAKKTAKKDPVLGGVSAEARKNMKDATTIRGKVKARKAYLDSI